MKVTPAHYTESMILAALAGKKATIRVPMAIQPPGPGYQLLKLAGVHRPDLKPHVGKSYWGKKNEKIQGPFFSNPFGEPGDLIWAKEDHYIYGTYVPNGTTQLGHQMFKFCSWEKPIHYYDTIPGNITLLKPGEAKGGWVEHSAHLMPMEYSRVWLRINSVRAERLKRITPSGISREGFESPLRNGAALKDLWAQWITNWNNLYRGTGMDWAEDPMVWVTEFERIPGPGLQPIEEWLTDQARAKEMNHYHLSAA